MSILKIRDENGNIQEILALRGEKGEPGNDYVLTEEDKREIADMIESGSGGGGEVPQVLIVKLSTHDYQEFDSSHSYEDIVQAFNNKKIINLLLDEYVFVLDAQYSVVDGEALQFVSQVYSSDFENDMCAIRKLLFKSDNSIEFSGNPIYLTDIDTVDNFLSSRGLGDGIQINEDIIDCNDLIYNGWYKVSGTTLNRPYWGDESEEIPCLVFVMSSDSVIYQLGFAEIDTHILRLRSYHESRGWSDWYETISGENFSLWLEQTMNMAITDEEDNNLKTDLDNLVWGNIDIALDAYGFHTYTDQGNIKRNVPTFEEVNEQIAGITYEQIGAAPAGYGLGEANGKYCTDCNTALNNGFYNLSGENCKNVPTDAQHHYGTMIVERRGATIIHQTVNRCNIIIQRYSGDGGSTWNQWEWVNPPLENNKEYRTTERSEGKPVYVKRISYTENDISALASGVNKYIPHGISGFSKLVKCNAVMDGSYPLPHISHRNNGNASFVSINNVNTINIAVTFINIEISKPSFIFDIYYIK